MTNFEKYDEDYFMRGKESGKSLYSDYRWLPDLTIPMAECIAEHCGMVKGTNVLDFGAARGYLVRALRGLGYNAFGYDISEWAVTHADEEAAKYLTMSADVAFNSGLTYDWIVAKDVLEHVEYARNTINQLMVSARVGVFAVVPLSKFKGSRYIIEEYEKDVTHCQRRPLWEWAEMFMQPGWSVEAAFRVPGVKDNYKHHLMGNGFLTARRIEEPK